MARLIVLAALLVLAGCVAADDSAHCERDCVNFHCVGGNGDSDSFPKEVCMDSKCFVAIKNHIKEELNAAFKYMYMGAHFAQYTIDRPGIAKFLFESASEERSHAILMLDYLNTRGMRLNFTDAYTFDPASQLTQEFEQGLVYKAALELALNMEIQVTNMIRNIVAECSDDYHAADIFTNPILDEQHQGMRKLQGAVKTFHDLTFGHTGEGLQMAEYIFDRKMLSGDI